MEDNFNIYYNSNASNEKAKCLISCKIESNVQNSVAISLILNNFLMHLNCFKIDYYVFINDCGSDILKGEEFSLINSNLIYCCSGVSVVNFMAGIANKEELKYCGEAVKIRPEAIENLRESGVQNYTGMSSIQNFKNLHTHIENIQKASLNFKKEFEDFFEHLFWFRKYIESSFIIQGALLVKLQKFNKMIPDWKASSKWLKYLEDTITFFLELISQGVEIRFNYISLYQPEEINKNNRNKSEDVMRKNFKLAGSEAFDLGYDLTFLADRENITCICEGTCFQHTAKERFECNICKDILIGDRSINAHLNKHYKNKRTSRKVKLLRFDCPHCTKNFGNRSDFIRHVKGHNFQKIQCDLCPGQFILEDDYQKHKKDHSSGTKIYCNICHSFLLNKDSFRKHRNNCPPRPREFKFKCSLCEKVYTRNSTLTQHFKREHLNHRN